MLTIDLFVYYASERREGVLSLKTICSLNAEEEQAEYVFCLSLTKAAFI